MLVSQPLPYIALLAYRIWSVARHATSTAASNRLIAVLRVVIESGVIYSVSVIVALACFVSGTPGVYVVLDLVSDECPWIS